MCVYSAGIAIGGLIDFPYNTLIQYEGDHNVYLLQNNIRRLIPSTIHFQAYVHMNKNDSDSFKIFISSWADLSYSFGTGIPGRNIITAPRWNVHPLRTQPNSWNDSRRKVLGTSNCGGFICAWPQWRFSCRSSAEFREISWWSHTWISWWRIVCHNGATIHLSNWSMYTHCSLMFT